MIGGIKTNNGINRIIPLHECIIKYVKNVSNSRLLNMYYSNYLLKYNIVKEKLKFKCTPYIGKHTFATLCNEYKLVEFLVKKLWSIVQKI